MKKRLLALLLALSMALSMLTGCGADAPAQESTPEDAAMEAITAAANELLSTHSSESGKEETVYVLTDGTGTPTKTIVSSWLKNPDGSDRLNDSTTLTQLENVKGQGGYTENTDGTITWDAAGADVYYQGVSQEPLPVEVSVRYELDGKAVQREALENVTGHLKISFSYVNHLSKTMDINGEASTIYQPFTMISGTLLDHSAANVTITNGQVISAGDNTVAVGIAMPGLKESLGLDKLTDSEGESISIDLPETVELEADVTSYTPGMLLTVATNTALQEIGLEDIHSLDDLKASMAELQDATDALRDGAKELNNGVGKLADGTGDLDSGVDRLADGVGTLQNGADALKNGTEQLSEGANVFADGLDDAFSGSEQLLSQGFEGEAGALAGSQALAKGAKTLNDAVKTAKGISFTDKRKETIAQKGAQGAAAYASTFANGVTASIAGRISVDEAAVEAIRKKASDTAQAQVQEQSVGKIAADKAMENPDVQKLIKAMIPGLVLSGVRLSQAQQVAEDSVRTLLTTVADSTAQQVAASVAGETAEETAKQFAATIAAALTSEETTQAVTDGLSDSLGQLGAGIATQTADSVMGEVNAGLSETFQTLGSATQQLSDGSERLAQGISTLYDKTGQLSAGLGQLNDGASQLGDGIEAVSDGAAQLSSGTDRLANGTEALDDGVSDLLSGVKRLLDGSGELADGLETYSAEGIEKLTQLVDSDLEGLWQRLQALRDYAHEYRTFSGCLNEMDCSVRFIFKIS